MQVLRPGWGTVMLPVEGGMLAGGALSEMRREECWLVLEWVILLEWRRRSGTSVVGAGQHDAVIQAQGPQLTLLPLVVWGVLLALGPL